MPQDLIVVGFKGPRRASEVLSEMQKLHDDWTIDLHDGVSAYRTDDGQLRIDQSVQATRSDGAGTGALVGGLLGALLAAPFTGGLSAVAAAGAMGVGAASGGAVGAAAGAGDAAEWKRRYGISDEFVADVGKLIKPGDSAVFVLLRAARPEVVVEKFRGYGGQILRTNLPAPAAEHVQRALEA
jgi:uncharacterized membrane protein